MTPFLLILGGLWLQFTACGLRVLLTCHDLHERFDAFDLGAGDHAVAEVEDEAGLCAGLFEYALCFDSSDLGRCR